MIGIFHNYNSNALIIGSSFLDIRIFHYHNANVLYDHFYDVLAYFIIIMVMHYWIIFMGYMRLFIITLNASISL